MDTARRQILAQSLQLDYDTELPIVQRREEIAALIRENQVVVVCGETGSGKSTQLPKICLETGRGIKGYIGHTQPRRIAARSIAARIADELQTPLGQSVGYKVRFDEKCTDNTLIKLMTDGILLAESQSSQLFRQYDTIIIDEAHERSLNIDFLLGMMKRVLPQRPDLKLIITSATIDAKRFAEHFVTGQKPVPVIEVSGRTYPIEIRYRSLEDFDALSEDGDVSRETDTEQRAILSSVNECTKQGSGDILIFLPTERDILETAKTLRKNFVHIGILPLYARLPASRQQEVFRMSKHRRIVLATNVAESSLTVPGIRYVIDTGTARISRYNSRTRTQRLPIEAVSQASADQRAGRCGRVGPGVCFRLFSELDYKHRDRYTAPEIQRTNLASVILQTLALKLGDISRFPFLDPPKPATIADGFKTLFEIGAIDEHKRLTKTGWKLSRLPVDPRIGRMILAAEENGCLPEMLIIAAALETQDPRERPPEFQGKADAAHAPFLDNRSDFIGYLKLWNFYQNLKEKTSRSGLRKACQQHFLSFNRLKEWGDVHLELLREFNVTNTVSSPPPDSENNKLENSKYDAIHKSILAGNLSGIAKREANNEYTAASGGKFVLWLGSGIMKQNTAPGGRYKTSAQSEKSKSSLPHWLLAAERVETSRKYLRTVAQIDDRWIEPMAEHLIQKTYHEPHWDKETGYVHAYEKVTLFGITLVPKRRMNFGAVAPKQSRDIFIQNALVEGDFETDLPFFVHNQKMLEEAKKLQDKLRHHDLLKPETVRYQFYQEHIPDEVFDRRSLEKFCKTHNTDFLCLTLEQLLDESARRDIAADKNFYPDKIRVASESAFDVEYKYNPGEANDGLTVIVPKEKLPQLEPQRLGWLVPGLLEQKITALLKSLPKDIRRMIVPIPDTVRDLMKKITFADGDLEEKICKEVTRLAGRIVVRSDFNAEHIPPELRMNIRVLDEKGETIKEDKDLASLRKELTPQTFRAEQPSAAAPASPFAVFYTEHRREIKTQIQWLPNVEKLRIYSQPLPEFKFDEQVGLLIAKRTLGENPGASPPCSITAATQEVTKLLAVMLENYFEARKTLEKHKKLFSRSIDDAGEALKRLVVPHFLTATPWQWLQHYPRYFKAVAVRFEKTAVNADTDVAELQRYWKQYEDRKELHYAAGIDDPELETFRWMLEEYRVSLFAQRLGTVVKVSPQRLDKQFEKVRI